MSRTEGRGAGGPGCGRGVGSPRELRPPGDGVLGLACAPAQVPSTAAPLRAGGLPGGMGEGTWLSRSAVMGVRARATPVSTSGARVICLPAVVMCKWGRCPRAQAVFPIIRDYTQSAAACLRGLWAPGAPTAKRHGLGPAWGRWGPARPFPSLLACPKRGNVGAPVHRWDPSHTRPLPPRLCSVCRAAWAWGEGGS